jgi:hypothetical protein
MRVLLGLAALAAIMPLSAAQAQNFTSATFGASNATPWVASPPDARPDNGRTPTRIHRGLPVAWGYSGYTDYGDFDGNRSFDADKWNDWWHERPDRAFPRWMTRNQDCARKWYSGDVLSC